MDINPYWIRSHRCDPLVRPLADRHYNRQSIGAKHFVPPGGCLVLRTQTCDAFWVTSTPFAEFVHHEWAGAWMCSAFRNEGNVLSSDLIRAAVAATLAQFGKPPPQGFVTFVDTRKTRRKRDPGRCYLKAGWKRPNCSYCGGYGANIFFLLPIRSFLLIPCKACDGCGPALTKQNRLVVLQLLPEEMGEPQSIIENQTTFDFNLLPDHPAATY